MSFKLRSERFLTLLFLVTVRIDFSASLLTAGVKLINILLCLVFLHGLPLKVYPRKSNDLFG